MPFSLLPHASTTVLAVKGSLRRALRRALDGSGPFCKTFPSKREKGRSRTGTLQSNGLPLVGTARLHKGWNPAAYRVMGLDAKPTAAWHSVLR
jgi:hypothetical protein